MGAAVSLAPERKALWSSATTAMHPTSVSSRCATHFMSHSADFSFSSQILLHLAVGAGLIELLVIWTELQPRKEGIPYADHGSPLLEAYLHVRDGVKYLLAVVKARRGYRV